MLKYRNNHSHAIYTSKQCNRRSNKATIGLEGSFDNFTDFVLCWFHPFSRGIWCDTEIQEWLFHWHDKALCYRSYCNKTKLVIRWKNTWNNDFKNINKNNISICLSIQSFDITLNHLRMTQTICKCLHEFLLYWNHYATEQPTVRYQARSFRTWLWFKPTDSCLLASV